jgi:hypothetical protein
MGLSSVDETIHKRFSLMIIINCVLALTFEQSYFFTNAGIIPVALLTGASHHTKEAVFQKGYRNFNKLTSYDGTLLDHLFDHITYLSTASSFWLIPAMTMVATYPYEWVCPHRTMRTFCCRWQPTLLTFTKNGAFPSRYCSGKSF